MKGRQQRRTRRVASHDQTALAVMAMTVVRREHLGRLPAELRHIDAHPSMPRLITSHARDIARCLQRPVNEWPKLRVSNEAKDAAERLLSSSRRRYVHYKRS